MTTMTDDDTLLTFFYTHICVLNTVTNTNSAISLK